MALLRISEKQLVQACKDYKQLCEKGQVKRPDFWHFCGWIGETSTEIFMARDMHIYVRPDQHQ